MITKELMKQIINETVKNTINETETLSNESDNIQNIIVSLQDMYQRVRQKGVSPHEITLTQIAKMIEQLKKIKIHWEKVIMW